MKRIISALLILTLALSFCGCGSSETEEAFTSDSTTAAEVTTEPEVTTTTEATTTEAVTTTAETTTEATTTTTEATTATTTAATTVTTATTVAEVKAHVDEIIDISSEDLIEAMGLGWNLGNSFDSQGSSETSWGNPKTTEAMIDCIYELGFTTIRIPVSWSYHCDDDYTISESFLARVQEVVDWALENDMYVIIDSHHDDAAFDPTQHDQAVNYITTIWTQIAEWFKDYDEHLIFEVMNEPRIVGDSNNHEWDYSRSYAPTVSAMKTIMDCNQAFVNVVRASGGNNASRFLMASTYCGSAYSAVNSDFELPTDTVSDRIIVSVHAYTPYNLCQNDNMSYTDFDNTAISEINSILRQLRNKFTNNGVQVVITEFGCIYKDNDEDRYEWAKYFVSKAKSYGIACVVWDNNYSSTGSDTFGIFNRRELTVYENAETYLQGLLDGMK